MFIILQFRINSCETSLCSLHLKYYVIFTMISYTYMLHQHLLATLLFGLMRLSYFHFDNQVISTFRKPKGWLETERNRKKRKKGMKDVGGELTRRQSNITALEALILEPIQTISAMFCKCASYSINAIHQYNTGVHHL